MDDLERKNMLELLGTVDLITSETHRPAELRQIVKSIPNRPSPTVYGWVDRAVGHGLMAKSISESGYKAASITLKGYRLLGQKETVPVEAPEAQKGVFTYKQAYLLISDIFVNGGALGRPERDLLKEAIDKLITE